MGNVQLSINPENSPVRVNDRRRIEVTTVGRGLEDWHDDDDFEIPREFGKGCRGLARNWFCKVLGVDLFRRVENIACGTTPAGKRHVLRSAPLREYAESFFSNWRRGR
jgi:hypothetical protein